MRTERRGRYVFIRVLEACNAGCFMCGYARSKDKYRFGVDTLTTWLPRLRDANVKYLRYTGGEPLMHREILDLIRVPSSAGIKVSMITNGWRLQRMAGQLIDAHLDLTVVSIDGASARTHDLFRKTPGLFDRAMAGIRALVELGTRVRVNTVVGPHNFKEMPALRDVLEDCGIWQWDLSALKLPDSTEYYTDPDEVLRVGEQLFEHGVLRPIGKRWYGETPEERERYLSEGIPPRPSGKRCHVTSDVTFIDPRSEQMFPCAHLPHHPSAPAFGAKVDVDLLDLDAPDIRSLRSFYSAEGPSSCSGCSAAAAAYSDQVEAGNPLYDWTY